MSFYINLTTPRTTEPDYASLLTALRTAVDATVGLRRDDLAHWMIKKATFWTAPQIASAQSALDTAIDRTDELTAQSEVDRLGIREKAICLTLLDQINLLRTQPTTVMSTVTPAQAIAAIRTKAGTL